MLEFQVNRKKEENGNITYVLLQRISPIKRSLMGRLEFPLGNAIKIDNREVPFDQTGKLANIETNGFKEIAQISGWRLNLIHHYLKELLKRNGNKIPIPREPEAHFIIKEDSGIRLTLLFKSIFNLSKNKKITQVLDNIRTMSIEEIYYWYAKISNPLLNGRGLKAFRILMTE